MKNNEIQELLKSWNRQNGLNLPLSTELLEATFFSWPSNRRFVLQGPSYGILLKRIGDRFHIHLAVVHADNPSSEIYESALKETESLVREQLEKSVPLKIIFGGGDEHLFPGIPLLEHEKKWLSYFSKSGPEVFDFQGLISNVLNKSEAISLQGELRNARSQIEENELVQFVQKEFPGRWHREILKDFENSKMEHYFAYFKENKILGYVRLYGWCLDYWAPGVYFAIPKSAVGGLGPIGVASSERGRGIGQEILKSSWNILKVKGCKTVRIDWTTEIDFYEKAGLQTVQGYQPAQRIL